MSQVIFGMLALSGRITMLGLSRWTEKGGSYTCACAQCRCRTLQRFYSSELPWQAIHWLLVRLNFLKSTGQYLIAGDEVVDSKAGKAAYGLERFFSSIQQRVIPGLAFFTFSLVDVEAERSYPLQITQVVRSAEEKAASKARKEAKKAPAQASEKRKRGRPKGIQASSEAQSRVGTHPNCIEKPAGYDWRLLITQICSDGRAFWQLSERLHGTEYRPAPDFEDALRRCPVFAVRR